MYSITFKHFTPTCLSWEGNHTCENKATAPKCMSSEAEEVSGIKLPLNVTVLSFFSKSHEVYRSENSHQNIANHLHHPHWTWFSTSSLTCIQASSSKRNLWINPVINPPCALYVLAVFSYSATLLHALVSNLLRTKLGKGRVNPLPAQPKLQQQCHMVLETLNGGRLAGSAGIKTMLVQPLQEAC